MNDVVTGALVGALATLIGVLSTLVIQRVVLRQKAHELFLTSLEHLGGGSQERNLGISALEFYWKDYQKEQHLIIPVLVGAAIYLLTESKQSDAQHERYNLIRIMGLLLVNNEIVSSVRADESMTRCYCDLHKALRDWDPEGRSVTVKGETYTRGLIGIDDLVVGWRRKLEEQSWISDCPQVTVK